MKLPNSTLSHHLSAVLASILLASNSTHVNAENTLLAANAFDDLFQMETTSDEGTASSSEDLFGFSEPTTNEGTVSQWKGFFQFEAAHTYPSPSHLSKTKAIIELGTDGSFDNGISWKVSGRAAYDAAFELTNHYPSSVRDDRDLETDIHEAYIDISAGNVEFRLGRQQIIWGEMVGLFFADVVSAKDMRQFVAQDFDMIRVPQWAARAEYFAGDFHTEIIWIPYMTYNNIGKPGDDFYPLSMTPPANVDLKINSVEKPSNDLSNSSYGVRGSMLKAGWDISAFYYHSTNVDPVFFIETTFSPSPTLEVTPEHKRIHQAGATVAKDMGAVVFKSEMVYTKDGFVNVSDISDSDGVIDQDILDYIVALEHTTPDNTLLNIQLYQRWYTDHVDTLFFDEFETGVSLYGKMEFSNSLEAELTLISQFNRSDWMARPSVTWFFTESWYVQMGADIFGGNKAGIFGRFDQSDRVYTNLRYSF